MDIMLKSNSQSVLVYEPSKSEEIYVFMKLTDAALKAVEAAASEHSKSFGNIKFDSNNKVMTGGELTLPGSSTVYRFKASEIAQTGEQFDVIASGLKQLRRLGHMVRKLTVQGNDEAYTSAMAKIAQADSDVKKVRTKEIKGAAQKRKRQPESKTLQAIQKVATAKQAKFSAASTTSTTTPVSSSMSKTLSHSTTAPARPTSLSPKSVSAVSQRPLSDRIIHLLALRTYTKPELLLRLQQDGYSLADKTSFAAVLGRVGMYDTHKNSYTLQPKLYSEVDLKWPQYTEQDRIHVKERLDSMERATKRKQQLQKQSGSSKVVSGSPDSAAATPSPGSDCENRRPESEALTPLQSSNLTDDDEVKSICTSTERAHYKAIFERDYPLYLSVWNKLKATSVLIKTLEQRLETETPGSCEYEKTVDEILQLYEDRKTDTTFRQDLAQCDNLHRRLLLIKERIQEFDRAQREPLMDSPTTMKHRS